MREAQADQEGSANMDWLRLPPFVWCCLRVHWNVEDSEHAVLPLSGWCGVGFYDT